ncbi:hypothetical protein ScPMuIL_018256 [Solemya velum]
MVDLVSESWSQGDGFSIRVLVTNLVSVFSSHDVDLVSVSRSQYPVEKVIDLVSVSDHKVVDLVSVSWSHDGEFGIHILLTRTHSLSRSLSDCVGRIQLTVWTGVLSAGHLRTRS